MVERNVTFVELHYLSAMIPQSSPSESSKNHRYLPRFSLSNNSRFFRSLSHSLMKDLIGLQKSVVGGQVMVGK